MEFVWDPRKDSLNLQKHGIKFGVAVRIFDDSLRIEYLDSFPGETRFRTTGFVDGRLITVVYTIRSGKIRIISARKATKYEHRQYAEENK